MSDSAYDRICWKGDWTDLPQSCGGAVEVWDQTIGCPECGMNLWYLPERDQWPAWNAHPPAVDHWEVFNRDPKGCAYNPYDVFFVLFTQVHPFQFDDAHDPGDEDGSPREDGCPR